MFLCFRVNVRLGVVGQCVRVFKNGIQEKGGSELEILNFAGNLGILFSPSSYIFNLLRYLNALFIADVCSGSKH